MSRFELIQHFFSRMQCQSCYNALDPNGIELIREGDGMFVVNVQCLHCSQPLGVALVGVESDGDRHETVLYEDPELTEAEQERLERFKPVDYDDVLDAHQFFSNLGSDWTNLLPPETSQWDITLEPEATDSAA